MENIYFLMIIALAALAVADLVVGVSNDTVNFLNSAIGSKAISFRTIMIVASLGIAFGAIFSSGMMEVARKGIFNPGEFYFNEIMFIFMAVMITDILLLDFFNTLGMPTSTTVSIVFELLGAAVAMSIIKIGIDGGTAGDIINYINTSKAMEIITGILLSVVIAFSIGAFVQWISRLLLSYDFERKAIWVGSLFGGIALSAITYFIFMKGIKGTPFAGESYEILGGVTIGTYLESNVFSIILISLVFWSLLSFLLTSAFKVNIYKVIIGVGTFALALAFAGNDLVNFIGVPIAAYQSYEAWVASGVPATEFSMEVLASKVPTPTLFLFISGLVMVATLWLSKKARYVTDTEINLARQHDAKERFEPNYLSRSIVRVTMLASQYTNTVIPNSVLERIDKRFKKPVIQLPKGKIHELPAFDMVRAAVNLMVAGILISIATSFKLPLSTTYVTFMVAMGTSLADRAWGSESAVYRVAGVLNVIGGWFLTAIVAFIASGIILAIISFGKGTAIGILLFVAILLLARNYISYNRRSKALLAEDRLIKAESSSIQGVISESSKNISNAMKRSGKLYRNCIEGLARQDLDRLKKNKTSVVKLSKEIDELRDHLFYFIKNLDESNVEASNFYINILSYLTDISQSLEYISKITHKHVNNHHKKLKFNQIKELTEINHELETLFMDTKDAFDNGSFEKIGKILTKKQELYSLVKDKIEKQIARTRSEESSPKNTTLYFSLLLETKDLMEATMELLELYYQKYDKNVPAAGVSTE
ncbi:Phosphate transporter family protein [Muriicola jejuensis]|uniref:Phosphate transporter n=1 Tax=Muriicola jejuensis TaxID=504488 RepID=A0A6P0UHX2_9FLAO|nr:inorganic phosphate transporter [Muriicola jejuensis]NER09756.1 inorganic phosphate transporter [Muriicola jejuensis]SMP05973.1 Phosphate transporter family protein [Muriicola jejuensis]